jgi:uncharacterized protein YndB with AHSA1/START domain
VTDFATISRNGASAVVRFERWYAAPAGELWSALTDPDRMARWLGATVTLNPAPGGAIRLRWEGGEEMDGEITAFEPGRLLAFTWREPGLGGDSAVRFELRPGEERTLLILEHVSVPADQAAGFGAGWHGHLDALAAELSGQPADPQQRYRELAPVYARSSG